MTLPPRIPEKRNIIRQLESVAESANVAGFIKVAEAMMAQELV